jgi:excinuclease UvrABC nuclease subunit
MQAPCPTVKSALKVLPHEPGVYLFRDETGRVVYVGRSRDLARRARSYWIDLGDRPHLARMVARVRWVEPVICASEHEAAFLESDLMERHRTRYNRTLGMESRVWLRLDARSDSPSLEARHDVDQDGASWFGPYLGWEAARQAASGLQRVFPLRFAGSRLDRSDRELARSLGVVERDASALGDAITRVLSRRPAAVRGALSALETMRDRAASNLAFEHAAILQNEIRSVRWICETQKLDALAPVDGDHYGVARTTAVVLSLRGGRLEERRVLQARSVRPRAGGVDPEWRELAEDNARIMHALAQARALGPLGWRSRSRPRRS